MSDELSSTNYNEWKTLKEQHTNLFFFYRQ